MIWESVLEWAKGAFAMALAYHRGGSWRSCARPFHALGETYCFPFCATTESCGVFSCMRVFLVLTLRYYERRKET